MAKKKPSYQARQQEKQRQQELAKQKRKKLFAGVGLGLAVVLVVVLAVVFWPKGNAGQTTETSASGAHYFADITVQDYGTVTLELDETQAPITVANFVKLARSGFYDGLTFHRIMEGFMAQGGDPEGTGMGGSDETIYGEFSANGWNNNTISHVRGVISMARNGYDMNSASSQFFIVHQDSTFLDGQYAAFGHVTEGMEVIDQICADAEPTDDNGTIPAAQQPVITSIVIREAE